LLEIMTDVLPMDFTGNEKMQRIGRLVEGKSRTPTVMLKRKDAKVEISASSKLLKEVKKFEKI
jgi:hypothetical protein